MKTLIFAILLVVLITPSVVPGDSLRQQTTTNSSKCEPSTNCKECHADIYQQYNESSHAKAFANPLFWTQYFNEVVPRAVRDKSFEPVAKRCIFCHSPVLYMSYSGMIRFPEQAFFAETGVTCDFCHTFDGYNQNGDYQMITSGRKQGPLKDNSWHSQESFFIKTSDFCASCHNASNHLGTEARATFDEWKSSKFPDKQLSCQECHMNMHGYLKNGKAEFESGWAAKIKSDSFMFKTESEVVLSPERSKLYSHLFRSDAAAVNAINLDVTLGKVRMSDGKLLLNVKVNNNGSGHKMPSGSSDLRILWLEITATTPDGRVFTAKPLYSRDGSGVDYGITGSPPEDEEILGAVVPPGCRVYRAIFVNKNGRRASSFIDASKIIFDNRLDAGEIRFEKYSVQIQPEYSGTISISVTINYLGAPPSFTQRLGIPDYKAVRISAIRKDFAVPATGKK